MNNKNKTGANRILLYSFYVFLIVISFIFYSKLICKYII